jgi:hypothetical protein
MSALGAFCNMIIEFVEELKDTYPEETDLLTAYNFLKMIKQTNPRLIHKYYMDIIYNEFAQHIVNENEDYVMGRAKEILRSEYAEYAFALIVFDKHWIAMSETNKQHVWKYMKAIMLLAQRVPAV